MVSIVLSTYNRAGTLRMTLDSILQQTYEDFELIIVDDGSTDCTKELLKEYTDRRIRIFFLEENQFYCMAANYGLQQIKGEYVAFATSDDLWEKDKLELQMNYLENRKECGACFTYSDVIDENGESAKEQFDMLSGLLMKNFYTQKEWIQQFIFEGNCLSHPSAVVRKDVLDRVGNFNLLYCQSADMDLWLRIVRYYPIHVIDKELVHYRCYKNPQDQISGADELKAARFLNEHMIIRRKFIEDLSDEEVIKFFGDCFRNKDAGSHLELEIEKAFLLLHCAKGLPDFHILGIEKFEELLRNQEVVSILREKYHVKLQDIYEWNLGHFYMDFGIHVKLAERDHEILVLHEQLRKEKEYTQGLQRFRRELQDELKQAQNRIKEQEEELESKKNHIEEIQEKMIETELCLTVKEKELREEKETHKNTMFLLEEALLEKLKMQEERRKK